MNLYTQMVLEQQDASKPVVKKRTPISIISTSIRKQTAYYQALRGVRSQTKQLNIHFKTLHKKFFKKSFLANQISKKQKRVVQSYTKMKPNFQSTQYLSKQLEQITKQKCRQYYHSTDMIRDILLSERMFMNNKIIMVKFLNKLAKSLDEPNICWKAQYFHKKKTPKINYQDKKHINQVPEVIYTHRENQQDIYPPLLNNCDNIPADNRLASENKIAKQRQYPLNFIYTHPYGLMGHNNRFLQGFRANQQINYAKMQARQCKEYANMMNSIEKKEKSEQDSQK